MYELHKTCERAIQFVLRSDGGLTLAEDLERVMGMYSSTGVQSDSD